MDPRYLGIIAVLVVGVAVVAWGWWRDRQATKREIEATTAPPKRDIPRFEPDTKPPEYLTELQARTSPENAPPTDLEAATRDDITKALGDAPSFPAGYPRREFITDSKSGWAVLEDAMVLVCSDEIGSIRELLTSMERAQLSGHALVVLAPDISDEVIDTLRANSVQGKLPCLPLLLADPEMLTRIAALSGGTVASHDDLQADAVNDDTLGRVKRWVADQDDSWVFV